VPVSREDIDEIAHVETRGACTLSLYVSLASERQVEKTYRNVFKDLVKAVGAAPSARARGLYVATD
jgi:hypothetical protein